MFHYRRRRKSMKQVQSLFALGEIAAGEFFYYKRMN